MHFMFSTQLEGYDFVSNQAIDASNTLGAIVATLGLGAGDASWWNRLVNFCSPCHRIVEKGGAFVSARRLPKIS